MVKSPSPIPPLMDTPRELTHREEKANPHLLPETETNWRGAMRMGAERGMWAVKGSGEQLGLSGAVWETGRTSGLYHSSPAPLQHWEVKVMEGNPWAGKPCSNRVEHS